MESFHFDLVTPDAILFQRKQLAAAAAESAEAIEDEEEEFEEEEDEDVEEGAEKEKSSAAKKRKSPADKKKSAKKSKTPVGAKVTKEGEAEGEEKKESAEQADKLNKESNSPAVEEEEKPIAPPEGSNQVGLTFLPSETAFLIMFIQILSTVLLRVLPPLYKNLNDPKNNEVTAISLALAIAKLIKRFPQKLLELSLPRLFGGTERAKSRFESTLTYLKCSFLAICKNLKRRDQVPRDITRETLGKVAVELVSKRKAEKKSVFLTVFRSGNQIPSIPHYSTAKQLASGKDHSIARVSPIAQASLLGI